MVPLTSQPSAPDVSILIVSFNTRDVLRECLQSIERESGGLRVEVSIVDNHSSDGSPEMIEREFPGVRLMRSQTNLGFGAANNAALEGCTGRYIVLLNSDAFLCPDALRLAVKHMDENPQVGLGGGRLVGRDFSWQPSARMFPGILSDLSVMTGLAGRYPKSRIFGYFDRTWADQSLPSEVDWVPGAFSIIRADLLTRIGFFDPAFFLYSEEVDLCRRIQAARYRIWYWPDITVIHIGGESSRQVKSLEMSTTGAQLVLWRMRSTLLYYRKHHGSKAWLARMLELTLYRLTALRNSFSKDPRRVARAQNSRNQARLMHQAWQDTKGGRVSPPRPW
ncbi:glycosyltransferase family 2 protein [Silvibacterium dinghuense]|uniref:Glycosyltransferase family 2 protein n=1 Tax=Silvibacterium dinghuense TaxID=1560006 RepID=A0A4Q1SHB5_9BACT|nr:glycosyltransferase family 2 protein [Silvibacterium dinghuense]RXS96769.1 glycosyltransferase family 2 protein [Silvibacterium dinghuense]GGG93457.1 glycosyl transferase [Silvibacterium dinghuense]